MKIKGHLKPIILKFLHKGEAKTGTELIDQIKDHLGVEPSCGSIYPLLKKLREKNLIQMQKVGRKKKYSLTEKGESAVNKIEEKRREIIDSVLQALRTLKTIHEEEELEPLIENVRLSKEGKFPQFPQLFKLHKLLISENWEGKEDKVKKEFERTFKNLRKISED